MTTTTAALDNVIEHATETTKAAGERVREFAQIGVRKATEGLEQVSKAARDASEELTGQLTQARESASQAGLKLLEIKNRVLIRSIIVEVNKYLVVRIINLSNVLCFHNALHWFPWSFIKTLFN